jgi:pimeloyl-ACP methyl ester carboxylesterase
MKTIRTKLLEIAYFDDGPQDGEPLLLLHGWPESPIGFQQISSHLHGAGFRTIAPFLRGFGATRFLSPDTPRVRVAAALAQDALDLMDCLGIHRFSVIGHDWGARTGYALAALAPEQLRIPTLRPIPIKAEQVGKHRGLDLDDSRRIRLLRPAQRIGRIRAIFHG